MTEADDVRSRIQKWIEENGNRNYEFSEKSADLINAMIKRKNKMKHKKYYCPCMVVKSELDPNNKEYNDSIECLPCLSVRDRDLAKKGIENDGKCHCGMIVKKH